MRFIPFLIILVIYSCSPKNEVRLNDIQVIGSHNSYKQAIEKPIMRMLLAKDSNNIGLDYHHISLKEQLTLGLRGLEIDVLHDPEGGRFRYPVGLKLAQEKGFTLAPYDTLDQLTMAGFKVLHIPDVDFRSHCLTFIGCLTEIRD